MLAWEGFNKGVDYPLDLDITDIDIADPAGRRLAAAPQAHLTFSAAALLWAGSSRASIEVDQARIAVTRDMEARIGFGGNPAEAGGASAGFSCVARSACASRQHRSRDEPGVLDQIRRVHFRDAEVTATDGKTGLVLTDGRDEHRPDPPGNRTRRRHLNAPLSLGDEKADLFAHLDFVPAGSTRLDRQAVALPPRRHPPSLARPGGDRAGIAGGDGGFRCRVRREPRFRDSALRAGGHSRSARASFRCSSGAISLAATPDMLTIRSAHFNVARTAQDAPEIIDIGGTVTRAAERLTAEMTVGARPDRCRRCAAALARRGGRRVAAMDRARTLPAGVARHGSAAWSSRRTMR